MNYSALKKFFSIKIILILLLAWILMNIWMRFGASGSNTLKQLSGESQIPDTLFFGYSLERLSAMLQKFGYEGRLLYLRFQLKDYIYPLIYSTLIVGLLARVRLPKKISFLVFLPWLAAIFDYVENIIIRNQVINFPNLNSNLVTIASDATLLKWSLIFISGLLVLVFWVVSLFRVS